MRIELISGFRLLVSASEFSEEDKGKYQEIYINAIDGVYKRITLSYGRFIQLKLTDSQVPKEIKEAIKANTPVVPTIGVDLTTFLPGGKIPDLLWRQTVKFFRDVMTTSAKDLEAMVYIMWHPDRGYYLNVPEQTATKGSVNFGITNEDLPEGSVIVVDIHSH